MRFSPTVYPVDRYLVESSNKMEMVNVTDDEIWNTAPAVRPEDEAMLSKLNEMLQATADDLKLISGELMQLRRPRPRVRAPPAPLDDEFNEKVHIEEIVDAKFHRCNILDKSLSRKSQRGAGTKNSNLYIKPIPKTVNASVQVNRPSNSSKGSYKKNLAISHTNIVQIDEHFKDNVKDVNNAKSSLGGPYVSYNEFSHSYDEPKRKQCSQKPLRVQEMPSINIRSELTEQKVLQLDITPEQSGSARIVRAPSNVAVIALQHEPAPGLANTSANYPPVVHTTTCATKPAVRRVSKMLPSESSDSSVNVRSHAQHRVVTRTVSKPAQSPSRPIATHLASRNNTNPKNKTALDTRNHRNVDEWKKKLNTIYGITSPMRNRKTCSNPKLKKSPTQPSAIQKNKKKSETGNILNNAEYIPYTKLTLGGMRVSDVEREISGVPDKNVPLDPRLDKMLNSRENSFHSNPKTKERNKNVLTASDEDLLQEVLDIERNVSEALARNLTKTISPLQSNTSTETSGSDKQTYPDDFEEEKTEHEDSLSDDPLKKTAEEPDGNSANGNIQTHVHNATYTRPSNLSFKDSVDIFEFVHSIDRQDHATQSNPVYKICLKATQTSPRNVQPIRNDLWPSENLKDDTREMFNNEFIKKLIVDECSEILKKNLSQPCTSKDKEDKRNLTASQKNTQTSPARVRSVMTSPTKTKTRTTSPAGPPPAVDRQTSPLAAIVAEKLRIELDEIDDLAVSINLSSPRFSLRLPRTSRDVLSNLDVTPSKFESKPSNTSALKTFKKCSSSCSADGDYSSSDISSLGEIEINQFKRRPRKTKNPPAYESSGSSVVSRYSSDVSSVILPLRSEGEVSVGNADLRKSRFSRSDGEVSLGQTLH